MNASTVTLDRREPRRSKPLVSNGVMGMLLFVFTEAMLFAGLISAHVIFMSGQVGQLWPPPGQPRLPFAETAVNSAALMVSGGILVLAHLAFRVDPRRALIPLGMSVALGAFFVGFQGMEWLGLLREGLTLRSSTYGAFFYLIVGAHALHAVAAITCLGWAWARLKRGVLTDTQFKTVQVFWYFVVLVWPMIYFQVYL
jgi:cytochrome c oxidase subunit 3